MIGDALILSAGDTDCEAFADGWLLQPVNAYSSLLFSLAGIALIAWARRIDGHERTLRTIFGVAMISTGIGSFLFHGFESSFAQFLHDFTFLVTIWLLAVMNVSETKEWSTKVGWGIVGAGAGAFAGALMIGPQITNVLTTIVVVALVGSDVVLHTRGASRSLWYWMALGATVLAVVAFVVGRSSGPLCDPESILQGHAAWHALSALAITSYFVATSEARVARTATAP